MIDTWVTKEDKEWSLPSDQSMEEAKQLGHSFIHSFTHSPSHYFLSAYCVFLHCRNSLIAGLSYLET